MNIFYIINHLMIIYLVLEINCELQIPVLYQKRHTFATLSGNISLSKNEDSICLCASNVDSNDKILFIENIHYWNIFINVNTNWFSFLYKRQSGKRKLQRNSRYCEIIKEKFQNVFKKSDVQKYEKHLENLSCKIENVTYIESLLDLKQLSSFPIPFRTDKIASHKSEKKSNDCITYYPCCTEYGKIVPASNKKKCGENWNECLVTSTCNGLTAECPTPEIRKDGTVCRGFVTCVAGICNSSICTKYDLQECQCQKGCEVCCRNSKNRCQSISLFEFGSHPYRFSTFCDNHTGYCNENGLCIHFTHSAIHSEEILRWIKLHWYSIVLLLLPLLSVLLLSVLLNKTTEIPILDFYNEVEVTYEKMKNRPKVQLSSRYMTDGVIQFCRIATLFPTVNLPLIGDCIYQVGKENCIIEMFLVNGIPMRVIYNENIKLPSKRTDLTIDSVSDNSVPIIQNNAIKATHIRKV
ncbi:uncharacterized protein LOC111624839 [Centruroides sculpturatus]|uniref:uncharacterized protein LOC111624839 n=1 Tax=Centruroides sculpturatus TaxID=218467 RepID=UPI000C6CBF57|nr:uncharacterized protein LOC111624839 [Centruroides sculpturatus]